MDFGSYRNLMLACEWRLNLSRLDNTTLNSILKDSNSSEAIWLLKSLRLPGDYNHYISLPAPFPSSRPINSCQIPSRTLPVFPPSRPINSCQIPSRTLPVFPPSRPINLPFLQSSLNLKNFNFQLNKYLIN